MVTNSLLSLLIWLPILGGILILVYGSAGHAHRARVIALITAVISLLLCVPLYLGFDPNSYSMQFTENIAWIPAYKIRYALGVDGVSVALIILANFITLVVVLASWHTIKIRVSQYMAAFLIMQGMMVGVFASLDAILFYVFWESMLIPMYLSIGIWGSANRSYASIKFFLYTFFGSALMLVALLYLHCQAHSFAILDFYPLLLSLPSQTLLFIAFLLAFAVKIPMWPFHTWLPDAHTEAPAGGSIVLAALMLKMGGYGLLRFTLPIVPDASHSLAWLLILLSLVAIVYIGLVAIVQADMKKLIAYSSVAHMGFVTLGCFLIYAIYDRLQQANVISLEGAMVQMISHAFSSGALFLGIGVLYERLHTRLIKDYGGVVNTMPVFAAFFMLFAMSNAGLPGTAGFVGEFLVLLSTFKVSIWITLVAGTTLILGAAYTLWMYKRVFWGPVAHDGIAHLSDINLWDKIIFALLAIVVIGFGIYPNGLLYLLHSTLEHLLQLSLQTKL